MKICVVGAKLFNTDRWMDRQTDVTKLIVAFCNFEKVPNNVCIRFTVSMLFVSAHVTTREPLNFVKYDIEQFY